MRYGTNCRVATRLVVVIRVIYQVNDDQVVVSVINIRHRRGVYRR